MATKEQWDQAVTWGVGWVIGWAITMTVIVIMGLTLEWVF